MAKTDGPVFVMQAATNIDRLVTVFKAARRSDRVLMQDLYTAEIACASPFFGFEKNWSVDWQQRYRAAAKQADYGVYICRSYSSECFQIRNEWMVDHSARVIAVFNGESGGTKNTTDYAREEEYPDCYYQAEKEEYMGAPLCWDETDLEKWQAEVSDDGLLMCTVYLESGPSAELSGGCAYR